MDRVGNGKVSYSEFITAGMERNLQLSDENLQKAFRHLANEQNEINSEDLRNAFGLETESLRQE